MFEIKCVVVPVNPKTWTVDVRTVEKAINKNTIAIVGSTPQYGQGVMDPIAGLSKIAVKHNVGLHVDCCLGSFLMATLRRMGSFDIPAFDFQCPGVTSISCDTHKYGFSVKGTSVIMFRSQQFRRHVVCYISPLLFHFRGRAIYAKTRKRTVFCLSDMVRWYVWYSYDWRISFGRCCCRHMVCNDEHRRTRLSSCRSQYYEGYPNMFESVESHLLILFYSFNCLFNIGWKIRKGFE